MPIPEYCKAPQEFGENPTMREIARQLFAEKNCGKSSVHGEPARARHEKIKPVLSFLLVPITRSTQTGTISS
jgi:hypothetical protein